MGRSSSPVDNHHDSTITRSTSPLHFLNPSAVAHLAHHHHHPHRASAEVDISRILDPSYLPSSSRAAHVSPTAVTAYVDPHGDLHDPDYRHFPVYAPHQHANQHSPKRRGNSPRRPHFDWEIELDEHALDDEYEEEGSFSKHNFTAPRYPTTPSSSRSWSSSGQSQAMRPRESSFSTTLSMPMSKYSPAHYSPTGTASTLPTSYEDDAHDLKADSPFEEKEKEKKKGRRLSKGEKEKEKVRAALEKEAAEQREKEAEKEREQIQEQEREEREYRDAQRKSLDYIDLTPSPRRISRTYGRTRHRALDLYDEEERAPRYADDDEEDSTHLHPGVLPTAGALGGVGDEYVPTCSQSLRRQWQAMALSLRFSLFRAQRRVMRRVASLTT